MGRLALTEPALLEEEHFLFHFLPPETLSEVLLQTSSYLQLSLIPASFGRKHPLALHLLTFGCVFGSRVLSQLCGVSNKAGCGGSGLCRGGPEAQRQIEAVWEMEAVSESGLIVCGS